VIAVDYPKAHAALGLELALAKLPHNAVNLRRYTPIMGRF
jgi:hypothetical protein